MRIFGLLILAAALTTTTKAHADEPDMFNFSASMNITVCDSNGRVNTCAVPMGKPTKIQLELAECIIQEDETICSGTYHMNRKQDDVEFDAMMKAQVTHHADGTVDYEFTAYLASPQLPDVTNLKLGMKQNQLPSMSSIKSGPVTTAPTKGTSRTYSADLLVGP